MKKHSGYSLLEILIVLSIIGVLVAAAATFFLRYQKIIQAFGSQLLYCKLMSK